MSNGEIKLFTDGEVKVGERQFTRLIGGFGESRAMFTIWQAGEFLNLPTRKITEDFTRNIDKFEENVDYKDLKSVIPQKDNEDIVGITKFLKDIGYSQNKLNRTKQWLIFSYSGMMKLVKIATTKESWDIYDKFLEDYFKTKAENEVMKHTIEEEINELIRDRYKISGLAVFQPIEDDRVEAQKRLLNLDDRIAKLKSTVDNESIRKALEKQAILVETKNKDNYLTQSEFGTRFNNKIGAKYIGKLLKIVGLAKKSYGRTVPYQEFVPKYATNIINNDREVDYDIFYKWNYNNCSKYINQWLLDNDYHDKFYGIIDKEELIKFIDSLYDKYINIDRLKIVK